MKLPNIKLIISILILAFLLTSCNNEPTDKTVEPKVNDDIEYMQGIDDISLRELKSVYADDDDTSVVTMYLTVTAGNSVDNTDHTWSDVNANSVYYYLENGIQRYAVEGILQVGDESGPLENEFGFGSVTPNTIVHIRGQTSSRSPQKSYKVEINNDSGMWRGQTNIALNKHVYDTVRFRNKLVYDLLKTIPAAFSSRTQFVHLYVKDLTTGNPDAGFVDHGLFTQAEQPNKKYLRARGLDENGHLYKAIMFEFERYYDDIKLESDPEFNLDSFEARLESRGNQDNSKLLNMLDEVNNYSMDFEEVFEKHFDAENYFTWLAFQLLVGNKDTTSQNFFLYSPLNGLKWYFIPWDNDDSFSHEEDFAFGYTTKYDYTFGPSIYWSSVIHKRILTSPKYRQMLDNKMNELRAVITRERIEELVWQYDSIVRPYLFSQPDAGYSPMTLPEYSRILQMIPNEMELNYNAYLASLKKPTPFYLGDPIIDKDNIVFSWNESTDFYNSQVRYTFELARDYNFSSIIFRADDLEMPAVRHNMLPPGEYFARITSENESGETQTAMEIFIAPNGSKHPGIMSFEISEDGTITRL